MIFVCVIDPMGVYGNYFHYGLVISIVGSAFLVFLYLWKKKCLHMDEEAKYQMLREIEPSGGEHEIGKKD